MSETFRPKSAFRPTDLPPARPISLKEMRAAERSFNERHGLPPAFNPFRRACTKAGPRLNA